MAKYGNRGIVFVCFLLLLQSQVLFASWRPIFFASILHAGIPRIDSPQLPPISDAHRRGVRLAKRKGNTCKPIHLSKSRPNISQLPRTDVRFKARDKARNIAAPTAKVPSSVTVDGDVKKISVSAEEIKLSRKMFRKIGLSNHDYNRINQRVKCDRKLYNAEHQEHSPPSNSDYTSYPTVPDYDNYDLDEEFDRTDEALMEEEDLIFQAMCSLPDLPDDSQEYYFFYWIEGTTRHVEIYEIPCLSPSIEEEGSEDERETYAAQKIQLWWTKNAVEARTAAEAKKFATRQKYWDNRIQDLIDEVPYPEQKTHRHAKTTNPGVRRYTSSPIAKQPNASFVKRSHK